LIVCFSYVPISFFCFGNIWYDGKEHYWRTFIFLKIPSKFWNYIKNIIFVWETFTLLYWGFLISTDLREGKAWKKLYVCTLQFWDL
jgi:hypothetical protein